MCPYTCSQCRGTCTLHEYFSFLLLTYTQLQYGIIVLLLHYIYSTLVTSYFAGCVLHQQIRKILNITNNWPIYV